jgi:hypothetical protein
MVDSMIDFVLGLFFGILIGILIIIGYSQPEKRIIEHGCAQYNKITGDFEWKHKLEE